MTPPVYLVDDDDAVRKALTLLLDTVGIQVIAFHTPEIFLQTISKLDPGCLILDIRMPMITGLKLQEQLTDGGINWPTIIISGHGDIEACRRAFQNGAIDFLSKPIDEQDLIDAIQAMPLRRYTDSAGTATKCDLSLAALRSPHHSNTGDRNEMHFDFADISFCLKRRVGSGTANSALSAPRYGVDGRSENHRILCR